MWNLDVASVLVGFVLGACFVVGLVAVTWRGCRDDRDPDDG